MTNDLRKNPRFVATQSIAARVQINGLDLPGNLHNFSSTGFAVVLAEEIAVAAPMPIDVFFSPDNGQTTLKISALAINTNDQGGTRLGCQITDLHDQAEACLLYTSRCV